jgi:hypothetical protein
VAATPYDRLLHVAGVPRQFWAVERAHVTFQTFKALRPWAQDEKPYAFLDRHQAAVYDELLGDHAPFAGLTVMVTADPTPLAAERAASLVVRSVLDRQSNAVIVWTGCTDLNQWGRPVGPPDDVVPDVVVVSGAHRDPSVQTIESVDRWRRWATSHTVCLVVGTGGHPLDVAINRFNFTPDVMLYGSSGAGHIKTYG